jgi:hypothetical protein
MRESFEDFVKHLESEDFEVAVPEWVLKLPEYEVLTFKGHVPLRVHILPRGEFRTIRVQLDITIGELMVRIAKEFGVSLLPPSPSVPFDKLFCYGRNGELLGPLTDLSMPLGRVLIQYRCKKKFGLELLRSIKVNVAWKVAPKEIMTPSEILDLFGLDYTQYTIYLPDSPDPLPLHVGIQIKRGDCFEAIKDGRYGSANG